METMQSTHPSPRQLAALALGRLKPDARDRLQAHVATCASCETFLAQTPPETLKSLLQQNVTPRNTADQPTSSFQREHVTNPAIDMSPQARALQRVIHPQGLPPPADGRRLHSAGVAATDEVPHRAAFGPRRHGLGLQGTPRTDGPPPGIEGDQPGACGQS